MYLILFNVLNMLMLCGIITEILADTASHVPTETNHFDISVNI